MSIGGKSLHKKDWLKIGVGVAAAATGLGAAGIGPMAGLFSAGAGAAGAGAGGVAAGEALALGGTAGMGAPMASMFGPSAAGAGLLEAMTPAATPWITEGAALSAGSAGELAALGSPLAPSGVGLLSGGNGMKALERAMKLQQLAGGGERQQPDQSQTWQGRPAVMPNDEAMQYIMEIWKNRRSA